MITATASIHSIKLYKYKYLKTINAFRRLVFTCLFRCEFSLVYISLNCKIVGFYLAIHLSIQTFASYFSKPFSHSFLILSALFLSIAYVPIEPKKKEIPFLKEKQKKIVSKTKTIGYIYMNGGFFLSKTDHKTQIVTCFRIFPIEFVD